MSRIFTLFSVFKEQNFSKLRAISTVQYVDEENALKTSACPNSP